MPGFTRVFKSPWLKLGQIYSTYAKSIPKVINQDVPSTFQACPAEKAFEPRHFLSQLSLRRLPSPIRKLIPLTKIPGMISFGSGSPNQSLFPIESLSFKLKDNVSINLTKEEAAVALQYSNTRGIPAFVELLHDFQLRTHPECYSSFEIIVTNGSQDGLGKVFEMLLSPGDSLLVESPTYSGSLAFLNPLGVNLIPVQLDECGIDPAKLSVLLDTWDEGRMRKPKVLYTIPTGGNPSGICTTEERKRQIYDLACRHNLIILEDDPYYFLQFSPQLSRSYFSMDNLGRVIRFDSFSKIISGGLRLGFVSGHPEFISQLELHSQSTLLHPSGVSQMLALKLLQHWSYDKFLDHALKVSNFYKRQRNLFQYYAERYLSGLATWNLPTAGMFFWIKLHCCTDSSDLVLTHAKDNLVLLVPGKEFLPFQASSPYVRASFSNVDDSQIELGMQRLQKAIVTSIPKVFS